MRRYAGKKVYVAIQSVATESLGGFYDNVEFKHFGKGLKGDINGDGVLNTTDVTALISHLLGLGSYSNSLCDVNGDGRVNNSDVTALINLVLAQ